MLVLLLLFLIMLILTGLSFFYKENLVKIMIINAIYTISALFIIYYAIILNSEPAFSLFDIIIIYILTAFIVNISLIKFYKQAKNE